MADARTFRLAPLTPVHIGSGERLAPEEYGIDQGEFVRLDTRRILRQLPEAERRKYEAAIDGGRLRDAQAVVRQAWEASLREQRPSPLERFRARIGPGSRDELRQIVEQPYRKGEVLALFRNPYSGAAVIPGSSVKGAIRTALASWLANAEPGEGRIRAAKQRRDSPFDGRRMEEAVFGYTGRETESDPLRLLHVTDAEWPAGAVQIDKPELTKLGRAEGMTQGIQMHLERLLSRADGEAPPDATMTVRLEPAGRPERKKLFERVFHWEELSYACNLFYTSRLNAEHRRFPLVANQSARWLPAQEAVNQGILLRLGRFCHFDSMSVETHREGWNAARREPIREIGSTRTLCPTASGGRVPFGWVLLEPVG